MPRTFPPYTPPPSTGVCGQFLTGKANMAWLRQEHGITAVSVALNGTEDSPDGVWAFDTPHPLIDSPFTLYTPDPVTGILTPSFTSPSPSPSLKGHQ